MSDNEEMIKLFNSKKPLTLEFTIEQNQVYLIKHMKPTSICYSAKKGETIDATFSFERYIPSTWELFKDWVHSKVFRHERYW